MSSMVIAPTIPPHVRLDADEPPLHDLLVVLARRDAAHRAIPPRVDVVYSPDRRKHG